MRYIQKMAIHPGRVLAREINFLGISQVDLAKKAGVSGKLISDIINEKALISPDLASAFEDIIGGSSEFWLTLCSNYEAILSDNRKIKRAIDDSDKYESEIKNAYSELLSVGIVRKVSKTYEKIMELNRFWGITTLDDLPKFTQIAFRQNSDKKIDPYSLAAWLRYGDKIAISNNIAEYDQNKLRDSLPKLKEIILNTSNNSIEEVRHILATCGVILVTTKYFKCTYTNGATRWLKGNPVIQLSDRGKSDDIVWFTLFHEIGHILKHGKKDAFVSVDNMGKKTEKELEADLFASEQLIPKYVYDKFINDYYYSSQINSDNIEKFCKEYNISKSVLVGRLQKTGKIDYRSFNKYKVTIVMSTSLSQMIK